MQGSSRSCFRLLLLPHSLLRALCPGRTLLVIKEMWPKYWHKIGFHHSWVTVPKHGLLCLTGRAVSQDALQFPLLKASVSELVGNLSQRKKSCKKWWIPSISPGWTHSLGPAPGILLMQAQPELWLPQTLLTLETSNHAWRKSPVSSSAWYHHLRGRYISWQLPGLPGSPTPCKMCFNLQTHLRSLRYSPIFPVSAQGEQHSKEIM